MTEVPMYNSTGARIGKVMLPEAVFGRKWNAALVAQVVEGQAANRRPNIAHTKNRGDVRGGGKKPWRQKGTGRARHGSIRSPLWKGGGVTHGPRSARNMKVKVNRRMAAGALRAVLSAKAHEGEMVVVDALTFHPVKTKQAALFFSNLLKEEALGRITKGNGALVLLPPHAKEAGRIMRNLPFVGLIDARNLTAYDALQYKYLILPQEVLAVWGEKK